MKGIVLGVLGLFLGLNVNGQGVTTTIPYRLVKGSMIVDFLVNGRLESFLFDTGAKTLITEELSRNLSLVNGVKQTINDANNKKVQLQKVTLNSISTADQKIGFKNFSVFVSDASWFSCFGVKGLIGSDIFEQCCITIDDRNKLITARKTNRLPGIPMRKMASFVSGANRYPIFNISIADREEVKVLFDTGSSSFLSLKNEDFKALLSKKAIRVLRRGKGASTMAMSGMEAAAENYLVELPLTSIASSKFVNMRCNTSDSPYTLMGTELLKHGKITLDYVGGAFYFEPYQKGPVTEERKNWNLDITMLNGETQVANVWGDLIGVVEPGDQITRIDGKPVQQLSFCESITKGLPVFKEKDRINLTVKTAKGLKEITIEKK
jgi:predicted aspartyl protease